MVFLMGLFGASSALCAGIFFAYMAKNIMSNAKRRRYARTLQNFRDKKARAKHFPREIYMNYFGLYSLLPPLRFERMLSHRFFDAWTKRNIPPEFHEHAHHIMAWNITFCLALLITSLPLGLAGFVVFILAGYLFLPGYLYRLKKKRSSELLRHQLIEFFETISDALKANKSLGQAIQSSAQLFDEPLGPCITKMIASLACGVSSDLAFCQGLDTLEIKEVHALSAALQIQYQTGGNLTELLAEFSNQFRQGILFEQNLLAQTAQGRLSVKVVAFVPPVLIVIMNIIVPGYFSAFLGSSLGRTLFIGALFLDAFGLLMVKRIMTFRGVGIS